MNSFVLMYDEEMGKVCNCSNDDCGFVWGLLVSLQIMIGLGLIVPAYILASTQSGCENLYVTPFTWLTIHASVWVLNCVTFFVLFLANSKLVKVHKVAYGVMTTLQYFGIVFIFAWGCVGASMADIGKCYMGAIISYAIIDLVFASGIFILVTLMISVYLNF